MRQEEHIGSPNLDTSTTNLLSTLAGIWGVSKVEALRRALAQTTVQAVDRPEAGALREEIAALNQALIEALIELAEREALVFTRLLEGAEVTEIIFETAKAARAQHTRASRLKAFEELQRSLSLTSAMAAEWQNAVHEARR